jgi:hypothetical protein
MLLSQLNVCERSPAFQQLSIQESFLNYLVHVSPCHVKLTQAIELVNLVDGYEWGGSSSNQKSRAD